jgi:rhodanese-related sulfurtransferase
MTTDTDTGSQFLDSLLKSTPSQVSQPKRGQNYNYPYRWYLKPDSSVVQLQADPQNRAYYQDKGYHLLGQNSGHAGGLSEEQQYLQVEYPQILKEQREKAALIIAIRRAGERYRDMSLEDTFDDYTVEEIRDYLKQIKAETGKDIRVILPKRAQAREDAADARLLSGVDTAESQSLEGLQSMLDRNRQLGPTLQGTGYDPLEQSRKPPAPAQSARSKP